MTSSRSIMILVPTRVGMILLGYVYGGKRQSCPHTRGDDPG